MLSTHNAIACLSVRWVYPRKTVEVRIMKFSPYGSPIPLVFAGKFHPVILRNSKGFHVSRGVIQGRGGKTSHFLGFDKKKQV